MPRTTEEYITTSDIIDPREFPAKWPRHTIVVRTHDAELGATHLVALCNSSTIIAYANTGALKQWHDVFEPSIRRMTEEDEALVEVRVQRLRVKLAAADLSPEIAGFLVGLVDIHALDATRLDRVLTALPSTSSDNANKSLACHERVLRVDPRDLRAKHGTKQMYVRLGCRCDDCREAYLEPATGEHEPAWTR